jgi:hypothetical protein
MICRRCAYAGQILSAGGPVEDIKAIHSMCTGRCDCQHRTVSYLNTELTNAKKDVVKDETEVPSERTPDAGYR